MPEISIVVIIYKIEEYLPKCIESILKQTYDDFELILVDDGSPDKCPQICDYYSEKDARIKVLHQRNQGAVAARWNGLLASNGKFLSILDGDDWIEPNMYQHMVEMLKDNDSDIAIVGYNEQCGKIFVPKGNAIQSGVYNGKAIETVWEKALYTGNFYEPGIIPAFWNKLIRRELFFDNLVPANSMLKMGEDASITFPLIARAKSIVIDNESHLYNYRVVEGSMSRTFDSMYFERVELLLKGLKENLSFNKLLFEDLPYYALFLIKIGLYQHFSATNKDSFFKKIYVLKNVMKTINKVLCFDNIRWEEFNYRDKKLMKSFSTQKTMLLVFYIYLDKLLGKIM